MKTKTPLFRFDRLLIAALALLATPQVQAQTTNTWVGNNGAAWRTAASWSSNAVPTSTTVARFTNTTTNTVGVNGNQTVPGNTNDVAGILFSGNGTVAITNSSTANNVTNNNAALRVFGWVQGGQTNLIVNDSSSGHLIITNNANNTAQLQFQLASGGVINVSNSGARVSLLSRIIEDSGETNTITKTGAGTLIIGGGDVNTWRGGVVLNAGVLQLNKSSALGAESGLGLTINGGSLDNGSGGAITLSNYAQTWGNNFTFIGTTNLNMGAGAVSLTGNRTVTVAANNFTVGGAISGVGNTLTKDGSGTMTLTGNGGNFGSLVVSAGVLRSRMTNTTLSTITVGSGAFLSYGTVANTPLGNATITLQNGSTFGQDGTMGGNTVAERTIGNNLVLGGNVTFGSFGDISYLGGNIDLGGSTRTITIATTTQVGGVISNGGLTIQNTSTTRSLTLTNGAATYTGPTTVNGGILALSGNGSLSASTALNLAGTSTNASFDISAISGGSTIVGSLAGAASSTITLGTKTLSAGGDNTSTTFAGAASGAGGGITKTGTGTMTFSGTSTYTGATTVSGGRFVMDGTNTSSAVTVVSGAFLSGSGRVGGLTIDGTVAPGNSVGTLSAGNTVLDAGGAFELEMYDWAGAAGSGWDLLAATGSLTLSNTTLTPFTINLVSMSATNATGTSINWNANQSFTNTFLTYSGSLIGAFDSAAFLINTNSFLNPVNGTFSITNVSGGLALLYTTAFTPATDYVWTAAGGEWSVADNWQGSQAPSNNSALVFTGPGGVATNNAAAGVSSVSGIAFSNTSGSVTLAGEALAIGGQGIVNQTANVHTISNNTSFTTNATINASGGELVIAGNLTNDVIGQSVTVSGASNTAISGIISGQGMLAKSGIGSLTLSGVNTYAGGTLITGGALVGTTTSLQGPITNSATLVFDQSGNGAYGGVVSGGGVLVKRGAGSVTLSGANSYSGGTLISAGALIGSTASLTGPITNSSTLVFDQTTNGTFSGAISGGGTLLKDGVGSLTLSGGNSYSGGTLISAGALIGSTASLTGPITNSSNATLVFSQTTNGTFSGAISGGGTLVKEGTGSVTLSGANSYSGGTLISAGALIGDTTSLQGPVTNSAALVFNTTTNGTFSGVISGGGAVTKSGSGTVTIDAAQTYLGLTRINAGGALALAGAGSLASSSGVDLVSTGVFDISGISGAGTTIGSLAGDSTSAVLLGSKTLTFGTSSSNSFPGVISGTGGLVKTGSGVQSLSNASTFSGGFTLQNGIARLQASSILETNVSTNILSSGFGTGALTVQGGRIQSSSTSGRTINNSVNIGGSFTVGATDSNGVITVSSATTGAATTLSTNATITTDSSAVWQQGITGAYTLTKAGAATLTLSGNGGNFSSLVVSAGTVSVQSANTISTVTVASGATLGYGTAINTPLGNAVITLQNGSVFGQDTAMGTTTAERIIGNNIVLGGDVTFGGFGLTSFLGGNLDLGGATRTITLGNSTQIGGVISDGGLTVQTTSAARSLTLTNGAATYSGPTTVNGGILALSGGGSLSASTAVNLSGSVTNASLDISGISGAGTTVGSLAVANNSSVVLGAKTLTFGADNFSTTIAGSVSGVGGGLTKSGNGVLTLSGANSYTGTTTINGGTVLLTNGSALADSSSVILADASGVTLDVRSSETIGSLSGGGSTGGSVALATGSTLTVAETGNATYAGTLSGAGGFAKSGGGTTTLSANNSGLSGAIAVNGGSLLATTSGALGTGAVTMTNGSTLAGSGVTLDNNFTIGAPPGPQVFYNENFNSIASGLPAGWSVRTSASTNSLGTATNFNTNAVDWSSSTGQFANFASTAGLTSTATSAQQSGSTNRALGMRQTGSVGDPGASFLYSFNTTGQTVDSISLDLLMLSVQTRLTTWSIEYGIGSAPTNFTLLGTWADPGTWGSTSTNFTSTLFGTNLNNQANLVFRVTALSASTGTGSRDTMGIDNFTINTLGGPTGSGTLGISEAGTAIFSGNVANLNQATLTAGVSNSLATFSGVISGAGSLDKTGAGTVTLSGPSANTFTGMTTVSAGTLQLNKTTDVAAIAGNLTVNSGATLLLSSSGNVANTSAVTLSGGTITRGDGVSEIFGPLTLGLAGGTLDFGAGAIGTLSFTGTYTPSALLTVQNFLPGNKLQFGSSLTSEQLNNSSLFAFSNGFTTGMEGGYFTITAIPEPSTYLAAAGLLSLMLWPSRKRLLKDAKKILGLRAPMRDRLARRAN